MILPRNRAYIDWKVPIDDEGNEIGTCTNMDSYQLYLDWLADYLFETEISVPRNQRGLLKEYTASGADHAVIDISDCLGYSLYKIESIEEGLMSYEERHQAELDFWNELTDAERAEQDEDDFLTSQADCLRLRQEYLDARCVPPHIQHADIPYRPVLAALFKAIPDHSRRYALLDSFYCNLNECASK